MENNHLQGWYNWDNLKILIIEDDYAQYLFLKEVLINTFININQTYTAFQTFEYLKRNKVNLIIINTSIPDNINFNLVKEIRDHYPFLPIIAFINHDSYKDEIKSLESGCDTFINKHIDSAQLLATLDDLLHRSTILNSVHI
ncbi:MAG: response regulator [Bacteroidales bacterium]|nr:response regulator [Bacteroidales bacterium]